MGGSLISTKLMIVLMVQYAAISGFSCYDRNWNRALYFLGALLISLAVVRMK